MFVILADYPFSVLLADRPAKRCQFTVCVRKADKQLRNSHKLMFSMKSLKCCPKIAQKGKKCSRLPELKNSFSKRQKLPNTIRTGLCLRYSAPSHIWKAVVVHIVQQKENVLSDARVEFTGERRKNTANFRQHVCGFLGNDLHWLPNLGSVHLNSSSTHIEKSLNGAIEMAV